MFRNKLRLSVLFVILLVPLFGCQAKETDTMNNGLPAVYFTVPLDRFEIPNAQPTFEEWTAQEDLLLASASSYRDMVDGPSFFLMPGEYRVWVLHEDSGEFRFVVKDQDDLYLAQKLMAERPSITGGRHWEYVDMSAEYPGFYGVEIWRIYSAKAPYSPRRIKAILVTNDVFLTSADLEQRLEEFQGNPFPGEIPEDKEIEELFSKTGLHMSFEPMNTTNLYSAMIDDGDFFILSSRQHPSIELVRMVRAGLNADDIWLPTPSQSIQSSFREKIRPASSEELEWYWDYYSKYGVRLTVNHAAIMADGTGAWPHIGATYMGGIDGRNVPQWLIHETRIEARQRPSDRRYSIYFSPFWERSVDLSQEIVTYYAGDENVNLPIISWGLSNEPTGAFEYTDESANGFREWLKERHKSIERLNEAWGSGYGDFSEIEPPANKPGAGPWVDWWEYNGTVFAKFYGEEAKARFLADPLKRPILHRLSDLDIARGGFVGARTIDYEKIASEMSPWTDWFGFHVYRPGDQLAMEMEYVRSIAPGSRIGLSEWNTHVGVDVGHYLSSLWLLAARGARRITIFPWGGILSDRHADWSKGLIDANGNPKEKFTATSQFAYEVHRLEPLLMDSDAVVPEQRIGIFYPRVDLAIGTVPTKQTWEEPVNGLTPVYGMIKQMGYWPEIITSTQILNGKLDELDAVVFVNAQHIKAEVIDIVKEYVKCGGIVVGDACTGIKDIYGKPQDTLESVFGVSHEAYYVDEQVSISNPVTGNMNLFDVPSFEFKSQGEHRIKVIDNGEVVARFPGFGGQGRGNPAAVVSQSGKGKVLYLATMLGSASLESNEGVRLLLQSFFDFAGLERCFSIQGLYDFEASSIRVEAPLVDTKGNTLIVMYNYSHMPTGEFQLILPKAQYADDYKAAYIIDVTSRDLTEVELQYTVDNLSISIPDLAIGNVILLLKDSYPFVSARMENEKVDNMGTLHVAPGETYVISVDVLNPSQEELKDMYCKLYLPRGWYQDSFDKAVESLQPGQTNSLTFTIRVPEHADKGRYNPFVIQLFVGEEKVGTPCTLLTRVLE